MARILYSTWGAGGIPVTFRGAGPDLLVNIAAIVLMKGHRDRAVAGNSRRRTQVTLKVADMFTWSAGLAMRSSTRANSRARAICIRAKPTVDACNMPASFDAVIILSSNFADSNLRALAKSTGVLRWQFRSRGYSSVKTCFNKMPSI